MIPQDWPEAGSYPYNNIVGVDPLLRDPENGDYRPTAGSAAEAYGCQTFLPEPGMKRVPGLIAPETGNLLTSPSESSALAPDTAGEAQVLPDAGNRLIPAMIEVGGPVSENTVWDAFLVRVISSVEVAKDATLTITPGTRVEFAGFHTIIVRGCLLAAGEPDQKIIFTAEDSLSIEGWAGIEFNNVPASNPPSRIEYCEFSYGRAQSYDPLPPASRDNIIGGVASSEAGGALTIINTSNLAILNSIFHNNRADFGGAIFCCYHATPLIAGNLIFDNEAYYCGSAVYMTCSYPRLFNNTIVNNSCLHENMFYLTAALQCHISKPLLINNIVRSNFTNHYSGAQVIENKEFYTSCNNIEFYTGGAGNIDQPAEFWLGGEYPYSLQSDSPCIDVGFEEGVVEYLLELDLAGCPRVSGDGIDLGAYEFEAVMSVDDVTGDDEACGGDADESATGDKHQLRLSCSPNPLSTADGMSGRIQFNLLAAGLVKLGLFDTQGRLTRQLAERVYQAGTHTVEFDTCEEKGGAESAYLRQGVYFLRLETESGLQGKRIVILR